MEIMQIKQVKIGGRRHHGIIDIQSGELEEGKGNFGKRILGPVVGIRLPNP
jgi:hypothetical protein